MKWIKKGLLVRPGKFEWMISYAQAPFVERRETYVYRIHFAGRDRSNRARGGYAVMDMGNPCKILSISERPFLDLGELGCFDDCGVMPSCLVHYQGHQFMYYTGWKQEVVTPFSFFIGLAISSDNGETFVRYSKAPVLGRTFHDPFLTCSPWVMIENGIWRMWYVSCTGWMCDPSNSKPKHYYHIKYAESVDGVNWKSEGVVCIDFRNDEYAIARPFVYKDKGLYKMLYCFRGGWNTYRAGYAESSDGLVWTRKDNEVGIDVSEEGWDSEMICYPSVFHHEGRTYMLYNGNGYGFTGFGLAVLDE